MENQSIEDQIKQCISFLRSSDNTKIQFATSWMSRALSQPVILSVLLNVYEQSSDQLERMHSIIYFAQSVKRIWDVLDSQSRFEINKRLINILINEKLYILRSQLIYAIQLTTSTGEFFGPLYSFINKIAQDGSDDHLLVALMLAPVFSSTEIQDNKEIVITFFVSLLERGFVSQHVETKLAALHLLLLCSNGFAQNPIFQEKFESFWMAAIGIMDIPECHSDYFTCRRVGTYLIYWIKQSAFRKINNPLPLLEKCMLYFTQESVQSNIRVVYIFYLIIQNICSVYPTIVLQSGAFPQIIQLVIALSASFYQPGDSLSLTSSNFFESIFTDLCKDPDVLTAIWQVLKEISSTEHGSFFSCCVLYAVFNNFPPFFNDKLEEITKLLYTSMSSKKRLLCEAAARTTTVFIELYGHQISFSDEIIGIVLEACKNEMSADLLLVFTNLLDITDNSDVIFDDAFVFLLNLVTSGPPDCKSAALSALASLASGSSNKITNSFPLLYQLISEIIQSQNEIIVSLQPLAIECLSRATSDIGDNYDEQLLQFCNFCVSHLNVSTEPSLIISCLNALEIVSQAHPKIALSTIGPALPFLSELASRDVSSQLSNSFAHTIDLYYSGASNDEEISDPYENLDLESYPEIMVTALSLRTLSCFAKEDPTLCHRFALHIMQCCELQKDSFSCICKSAAAVAIGNLSEGLTKLAYGLIGGQSQSISQIPARMGQVLTSLLSNSDNITLKSTCFKAVASVVEWHDYDSLSNSLKPILDIALESLSKKSHQLSYDISVIELIDSIYSCLNMIILSAEDLSPQLLSGFIQLFGDLTNHVDIRFKSLSARFFADLIQSSAPTLDMDFKMSAASFSAHLADSEGDQYAFACLRVISLKEKELASQIANDVKRICLTKLNLPISKSEQFLFMRDNAVTALAAYATNIFNDSFDFNECLPSMLSALPLVLDYSENLMVMNFFLWAFNKVNGKYNDLFLRVLISIFENPPSLISKLQIDDRTILNLRILLCQLMSNVSNSDNIVHLTIGDDAQKGLNLQEHIRIAMLQQQQS